MAESEPVSVGRIERFEVLERCPACGKSTRVKAIDGTGEAKTFTRISSKDGCPTCMTPEATHGG